MTKPLKDSNNSDVECSNLLSQPSNLLTDWQFNADLKSRWTSEVLVLPELNSRGLKQIIYSKC